MRAAVLEQVGTPLVIHDDVEIEEPRSGEVAVRIAHCGVCHSDLSMVDGTFPALVPIILGHEASGVVEAVGPNVTTLSVGDKVVLTPCAPCGRCPWCVRGEWSLCANSDALMTASHPDGTTRLSRRGDTVLVMGLGGVGLSVVQGAKLAGASRIVVSDPVADRREHAIALGATDALDPATDDVVAAAHDLSPDGIGVDWAFDAAGRSSLVATGLDAVRKGGTTVMVGVPGLADPFTYPIPALLAIGGKKLVGCLLGSCNALRDIPRLIGLAQNGQLDLGSLVTARRPLEDINLAMDDLRSSIGVRTVIDL